VLLVGVAIAEGDVWMRDMYVMVFCLWDHCCCCASIDLLRWAVLVAVADWEGV